MMPEQPDWRTFRVQCPDARDVFLVGDFNNWSTTATPMQRVRPGVWETRVAVPPGPHRHRYFVWRQGGGPAVVGDPWEPARCLGDRDREGDD